MRILVIGDPYCPSAALRDAFARLGDEHSVTFADVVEEPGWVPSTASERRIREATGSPEQVLALLDHHDVLVVQAAPVTEGVLEAAPSAAPGVLRARRPGERGRRRRDGARRAGRHHAGQERGRRRRAHDRVPRHARPTAAGGDRATSRAGGEFGHDNYEGAQLVRPRPRRSRPWASSATGRSAGASPSVRRAFEMRVLAYDPFVDPAAMRADDVEPVELRRPCSPDRTSSRSMPAPPPTNRGLIGAAEIARDEAGRLPRQHRPRLAARRGGRPIAALATGALAGLALDVASPSPETGRHSTARTSERGHHPPHRRRDLRDAGPRRRRWRSTRSSASRAGDPLRNVADRCRASRARGVSA